MVNSDHPTKVDILVLREGIEGRSTTSYAESLRNELPEYRIAHGQTPAEERELIRFARVVTGVRINTDLLARAERLELFASTFAGTDHLPIDALSDAGVIVTNAGGIHVPGIAEQALGYMLTFARQLHRAWHQKQRAEWHHFQPGELSGSVVTILGLGSIGTALVQQLTGFNVETIGIRNTPEKGGPVDEIKGFGRDELHDALARTDYLVIACPLTETTRGLIGREELITLPPSAILVNVARGPIVDTDALVHALKTGGIRGAALDVTQPEPLPESHPLWSLNNCLITPHTGGHVPPIWSRLTELVAHNLAVLEGEIAGPPRNVVMAPNRE